MFDWFKKQEVVPKEVKPRTSYFSTHVDDIEIGRLDRDQLMRDIKKQQPIFSGMFALDDSSTGYPDFKLLATGGNSISDVFVNWYASQGFIGYQLCGILAQNWLINKACTVPAEDAVRKGFSIVSEDGEELDPEAAKLLKRYDKKFGINAHLIEFIRKGRIFGVRIAMFKVESTDPEYYTKPFNIDGVTPGSYKGIVQIDPYWVAPLLDQAAASDPSSKSFYEPTYWMINGTQVHRTHLIIYRYADPVDILKPSYIYGGIPLTQMIMERVYAAERTANEAPQLVQTKRTNVWLTDMEKVMADPAKSLARIQQWADCRDNYGVKLGDKEGDEFEQFDTALSDLDAVIMTQYQIVAAIANMPSTKLLGTSPKGFGASGEYEESSYHESLETIQENSLTPFLERHHALVIQSFVKPKIKDIDVDTTVVWNPLDTPTAKELADTNYVKMQSDAMAVEIGAIEGQDVRDRLATDNTSGYNEMGLDDAPAPEQEPDLQDGNDPVPLPKPDATQED